MLHALGERDKKAKNIMGDGEKFGDWWRERHRGSLNVLTPLGVEGEALKVERMKSMEMMTEEETKASKRRTAAERWDKKTMPDDATALTVAPSL